MASADAVGTARRRRLAPVWLMGLANAPFGLFGGFLVLPLPQLLAAEHVPLERIAAITAACYSPGFWVFALGPLLDVRFSRRWYATVSAALAGLGLTAAVLAGTHLHLLEAALILGYAAAVVSSNALGGWLATITRAEDEARLSAWTQVAVFIGNSLMGVLGIELARHLARPVAAVLLGLLVFSPAAIFWWMPSPPPDRRLAVKASASLPVRCGRCCAGARCC